MRKLFICSDIEGTAGIACWDETDRSHPHEYDPVAAQMTREVAAACDGAHAGGVDEILVKDSHDSGHNISHLGLPEYAKLFRGWARHPYSMMHGVDREHEGVFLTGCHSAAGTNFNPLSHTMSLRITWAKLNGELLSEAHMNGLTASYLGVPVLMVTGDRGVCEDISRVNPAVATVPLIDGAGDGTLSVHPNCAVDMIRETAKKAAARKDKLECVLPMPGELCLDIRFRDHQQATRGSFYKDVKQLDEHTLRYETDDYFELLRFYHFMF